jgi:uncharacterized protein YbaR (Trm112 family)
MNEFLLQILVCPRSQQNLKVAEHTLLHSVNEAIESGTLKDDSGSLVGESIETLLIREDGLVAYPVRNDIPEMLAQRGIDLRPFSAR